MPRVLGALVARIAQRVAFAHIVGAFAARQRRCIKGHMTNQIKYIIVAADDVRQLIEEDALTAERIDDYTFAIGFVPVVQKRFKRLVACPHLVTRVAGQ